MPPSKRQPVWLRMLSPELPSIADRDRHHRNQECAERRSAGSIRNNEASHRKTSDDDSGSDSESTVDLEDLLREVVTPPTIPVNGQNNEDARGSLLDAAGGGDIAADLSDDENDKENNPQPLTPFKSPPPPKGKGKTSFEGIDPTNLLLPFDGTTGCFEKTMMCPNVLCRTKVSDDEMYLKPTLKTENAQCGFASELYMSCSLCDWGHCMCPMNGLEKGDTPDSSPTKKKKSKREAEAFHNCEINCAVAMCMQKLGKGFTHLALMMACLGISNSIGSTVKWKRLMNRMGLACWEVAEEAMEENRKVEKDLTIAEADEKLLKWLETEATEHDDIDKKRDECLHKLEGKIGIIMSADQGWQKKRIGTNGGDSLTSHNFGLGGYGQLPVACQSVSQCCRICDLAEKVGKAPKPHRCSKNHDRNKSSKSIEGYCNAQHCVDVNDSKHGVYAVGFVGDDDSTTRANLKHSCEEIIAVEHPETLDDDGNVPGHLKRKYGWPVTMPEDAVMREDGKMCKMTNEGERSKKAVLPDLKKDYGMLPLWCPEPTVHWFDRQHRMRAFGKRTFELRAPGNAKTKSALGLDKGECENAKRNLGYFPSKNQECDNQRFRDEAKCALHHMWDDHAHCDVEWCTALQAEHEPNPKKKRKLNNPKKHRNLEDPGDAKLFDRTCDHCLCPVEGEKMDEVHHPFQSQKNETYQRQMTATCPKDVFYGGTMQLHDGARLPLVTDSCGMCDGLQRIHHSIGLPPLKETFALWAHTKDQSDDCKKDHRKKPEIKKKRAEDKIRKMKEGMKKDRRAEKEGVTYGHGIALRKDISSSSQLYWTQTIASSVRNNLLEVYRKKGVVARC